MKLIDALKAQHDAWHDFAALGEACDEAIAHDPEIRAATDALVAWQRANPAPQPEGLAFKVALEGTRSRVAEVYALGWDEAYMHTRIAAYEAVIAGKGYEAEAAYYRRYNELVAVRDQLVAKYTEASGLAVARAAFRAANDTVAKILKLMEVGL